MPIFRVKLIVRNPTREVTTQIAGCVDDTVARVKARQLYDVEHVIWVKPVEEAVILPKVARPKLSEVPDSGLEM